MSYTLQAEDVQAMTEEAIEFIREHEPPEGYFVGMSFGKDSIVTDHLVKRAGVKHQTYYSATLIDPPELVRFGREHYPEVVRLRPDYTFWKGIQVKMIMPTRNRRWCCDKLKKATKASRAVPLKHRIMGLRAAESNNRAARPRYDLHASLGHYLYKPIFRWLEWHVWDYIKGQGLPYPSLYDEGFHRLGCVVCPFISNEVVLKRHKDRWPQFYRLLEIYMNRLWVEREQAFLDMGFTYEDYMTWPLWPTRLEREYENAQGGLWPVEEAR